MCGERPGISTFERETGSASSNHRPQAGRQEQSIANRERFLRRVKNYIRRAVSDAVRDRSIKDIQSTQSITIPRKDIAEPNFRHAPGGRREYVHPGNGDYVRGDKIPRPQGGSGGGGSQASNEGEGRTTSCSSCRATNSCSTSSTISNCRAS